MSRRHSSLARLAAPVAFLLAVTVAVLIVRSALKSDDEATGPTTARETVPATASRTSTRPGRTTRSPRARFYEIQPGDTLETVAAKFDTSVEQLLVLNPEVDPVALGIGERIRVK